MFRSDDVVQLVQEIGKRHSQEQNGLVLDAELEGRGRVTGNSCSSCGLLGIP